MPVRVCLPRQPELLVEVGAYRLDPYKLDPAIPLQQRTLLTIHAETYAPQPCWVYMRDQQLAVDVGLINQEEKSRLDYWATMDLIRERLRNWWGNDAMKCLTSIPQPAERTAEVEWGKPLPRGSFLES